MRKRAFSKRARFIFAVCFLYSFYIAGLSDVLGQESGSIMTEETDKRIYFSPANDFSSVKSFAPEIAKIGDDGNIAALLLKMSEVDVIAVMHASDADIEAGEIPFNPLMLGDDEFVYTPFFDSESGFREWYAAVPEDLRKNWVPIIIYGGQFFPIISYEEPLHAVLNVHLDTREVIYHDNMVWIRNNVEARNVAPDDVNVSISMSQSLPKHSNQALLLSDLKAYMTSTRVDQAYFYVSEGYDREKNMAMRSIIVFYISTSPLLEKEITEIESGFVLDTSKYDLAQDYSFSILALPETDAGKALIQSSEPFYVKEH